MQFLFVIYSIGLRLNIVSLTVFFEQVMFVQSKNIYFNSRLNCVFGD